MHALAMADDANREPGAPIGKDEIDGDFAEGAGSFDTTDGDYLFNENARGSQTQAALIGTVALRAQF